jgi:hypothetical protein
MSLSIRATSQSSGSRSRKVVIVLLIILTLFLIGTVVVLSSVSYWLAIPAAAYLTEEEVPWRPGDAIGSLRYSPPSSAQSHRRQMEVDDEMGDFVKPASETEWDVDGEGSGGYWMRNDWDGHVEGTHDWTRLFNVTERYVRHTSRLRRSMLTLDLAKQYRVSSTKRGKTTICRRNGARRGKSAGRVCLTSELHVHWSLVPN